jgi:hypothetical protein
MPALTHTHSVGVAESTSLTEQVPEETRKKHNILATIAANGKTTLAPALTNAITSAEAAADARALAVANARARPGGRQRARRR